MTLFSSSLSSLEISSSSSINTSSNDDDEEEDDDVIPGEIVNKSSFAENIDDGVDDHKRESGLVSPKGEDDD